MRGRLGGIIGAASQPFAGSASRIWSLGEVYSAKRGAYYTDVFGYGSPWPSSNWTIGLPQSCYAYWWGNVCEDRDWADATETGEATFSPTVTSPYGGMDFSYFWQRSTNAGVSWSTVAGSSGSATTGSEPLAVSLTLTGQTIANDEDRYRIVVNAGLKTFVGQTLALRFDTVTLSASYGLTSNSNNYYTSLSVASGTNFKYVTDATFVRVKYSADGFVPSSVVMQKSSDGGATWQAQTPDGTNLGYAEKSYTASASDNGAQWRGSWQFQGQTYYGPVATLTVT